MGNFTRSLFYFYLTKRLQTGSKPNSTKITDHVTAKLQTQNNFVLSRSSFGNARKSGSACTLVHSSFPRSSLDSKKFLCARKKFGQNNWSN
jgi:hypothetical protein